MTKPVRWYVSEAIVAEYALVPARPELKIRRSSHQQLLQLIKNQIPIIDRALETAALMLGSDQSRGYCLEMICADFLAGANLDNGDPSTLLFSMVRFFRFLSAEQKQMFLKDVNETAA